MLQKRDSFTLLVGVLPLIPFALVALGVSIAVSAQFNDDAMVKFVVFVLSLALLSLTYYYVGLQMPQMIYEVYHIIRHPRKTTLLTQQSSLDEMSVTEELPQNNFQEDSTKEPVQAVHPEQVQVTLQEPEPAPSIMVTRNEYYTREAQARENQLAEIRRYITETMIPFADDITINAIIEDIMKWADDSSHKPQSAKIPSYKLTTLDVRHFIWNIGKRLNRTRGDYSTILMGEFVKTMFADICKDTEAETLGKNLTLHPNRGKIKIDKPQGESYLFAA